MAVVNSKSDTVTKLDAIPREVADSYKYAGRLLISKDDVEVAADDNDNSVYRMTRVPSNACIKELNVLNDAITGGSNYDLGVYETAENGGAAVDADRFASGIDMSTARTLPLNAIYEAGLDIADGDKRLWEILGLSEDPHKHYDLCFTANTVGTAAGSLALEMVWSE